MYRHATNIYYVLDTIDEDIYFLYQYYADDQARPSISYLKVPVKSWESNTQIKLSPLEDDKAKKALINTIWSY